MAKQDWFAPSTLKADNSLLTAHPFLFSTGNICYNISIAFYGTISTAFAEGVIHGKDN
ncbi:hypothetical protein [Dialister sp.]|uniref:hypothetical protein n=1 Tax=Dialister sp. TaxID=1955814 RepID=UPI002E7FD2FA|nr:hypothetical protein [Dialister sp.]MEE3453668.1 hypothetical protein [Dialister sp.]